jgi:hypothetical protein
VLAPEPAAPPPEPPSDESSGPVAESGSSTTSLGFRAVGSTGHIARLSSSQQAQILHRRSHLGVDKIRALPHTTSDAGNCKGLASAPAAPSCLSCALANIKRTSHSGSLSAPDPEPGVLHYDLKEMVIRILRLHQA